MDSGKLKLITTILEDKKAIDISTINVSDLTTITDWFVICSGTSTRHIKSLADELDEKMSEENIRFLRKEGYNTARWILMDYGDVVVNIFDSENRKHYDIERLWSDGILKIKDKEE